MTNPGFNLIQRTATMLAALLAVASCGTVRDSLDASVPPAALAAPSFETVDPAEVEQLNQQLHRDFDFCSLLDESELAELGLLSGSADRERRSDGCVWTGADGLLLIVTGRVLGTGDPGRLYELAGELASPDSGTQTLGEIRTIALGDRSGLLLPVSPGICRVYMPGDGPVMIDVVAGSEIMMGEREFCPLTQRAAELVSVRLS